MVLNSKSRELTNLLICLEIWLMRNFMPCLIHSEIIGDPSNLIGSQQFELFPNRTTFCSKSHLFHSQWERQMQNNQWNCRKMKGKGSHCAANFSTFVPKSLFYTPTENKNECSKVVIDLSKRWWISWPEWIAILVWDQPCHFKSNSRCELIRFWNHTSDFRSQIKLHSTQCNYHT